MQLFLVHWESKGSEYRPLKKRWLDVSLLRFSAESFKRYSIARQIVLSWKEFPLLSSKPPFCWGRLGKYFWSASDRGLFDFRRYLGRIVVVMAVMTSTRNNFLTGFNFYVTLSNHRLNNSPSRLIWTCDSKSHPKSFILYQHSQSPI